MRMNDNFNIITGELKPQQAANTQNRRFASLEVLRKIKETKGQENQGELPSFNHRKLGTAQDSKLYQYSYLPRDVTSIGQHPFKFNDERASEIKKKHSEPISLMNATKAQFNLISHGLNSTADQNWETTKKRCPVSKFTDLGRINAPNYSETYKDEPNFGKKLSLCNTICEIQRSYGTDKFFRKLK